MDRRGEGGSTGLARCRGKRNYTGGEEEINNKGEDSGRGWGAEGRKGEENDPVVENEMKISTKTHKSTDTKHLNTQDIKDVIINSLSL